MCSDIGVLTAPGAELSACALLGFELFQQKFMAWFLSLV